MLVEKDFKAGKIVYYSDMYDKSYCKIKLIKITKRSTRKNYKNTYWFNAEIVDNSHLDGKTDPWYSNGKIHSYSNSFIYKNLADLKAGSNSYKKTQITFLSKALILGR